MPNTYEQQRNMHLGWLQKNEPEMARDLHFGALERLLSTPNFWDHIPPDQRPKTLTLLTQVQDVLSQALLLYEED